MGPSLAGRLVLPEPDRKQEHEYDGDPDEGRQKKEEQDGGARQDESLQILTDISESHHSAD